jgi:hypothetical protein
MTRSQQRFATASAAILVQVLLVMLFAHSFLPGKPREMAREMMLMLRPIFRPTLPPERLPDQPLPRMIAPPAVATPPAPGDRTFSVVPAPPTTLEGIGRALFGCSPERYGQLTREEQARCPPPGEGMARLSPDDRLLNPPRSQSRDEVMWAEVVAARNFMPNCPPGSGELVVTCMTRQIKEERARAKQALIEYQFEKMRRNAPPPPPRPLWVGVAPPKSQASQASQAGR